MPNAHRLLIAVPSRFSASASALRYGATVASRSLIEAVYAAGGEPVQLLPVAPGGRLDEAAAAARLRWADGVLLPGGGDLAAHWSGQDDHPTLYDVDDEQDGFDLAVAAATLAAGLPLLAVCRGLQVVNVLRGGTLIQDMDSGTGELRHHRHHRHDITVASGSRLSGIVGDTLHASCYHHQCLDRLGDGLVPVAHSEEGVIEAVEIPDAAGWFLGLQWHPEDTWADDPVQVNIFATFVDACRDGSA